ncbi:MAG: AzlC family ABC transporter permease [Pseudomonadota bacterium]
MERRSNSQFFEGVWTATPILFAVAFFGMLFGATAVNNGLTLGQTVLSSAVVFAGASQFVFLDLYNQQVPVWSVLVAVFAVNFRHVLYSASVGRHMGEFSTVSKYFAFFLLADPTFGASEQRTEKQKLMPSYYFGFATPFYPVWLLSTLIGGLSGNLISEPQALGMDMLLSIYFLSLLMGFRSRPNWLTSVLASGVVAILVYKYLGAPWHILMGAFAGILVAAIIGKPQQSGDREVG